MSENQNFGKPYGWFGLSLHRLLTSWWKNGAYEGVRNVSLTADLFKYGWPFTKGFSEWLYKALIYTCELSYE